MSKTPSWNYFKQHCLQMPELGMSIDISRMNAPDKLPDSLQKKFSIAEKEIEGWNTENAPANLSKLSKNLQKEKQILKLIGIMI